MGYVVFVLLLQPRAVNVDLQTDATLQVDISDALSERDKVKFTVHTKVCVCVVVWVCGCVFSFQLGVCDVGLTNSCDIIDTSCCIVPF